MKRALSLFFLQLAATVFAARPAVPELEIHGLDLPVFDATSNQLARRLIADKATGTYDKPKLTHGTVSVFSLVTASAEPIGKLFFDDAVLDRAKNEVTGEGAIRLTGPSGTVTGKGFRYNLTTNRLSILNAVHLDLAEAAVDAREADFLLSSAPTQEEAVILEGEVRGGVVAVTSGKLKSKVERAEAETATYNAETQLLHLSSPVTTWRKGEKTISSAREGFNLPVARPVKTPAPN